MMQISAETRHTLLSPQTNRALETVLRDATPQQREALQAQGGLRALVASLFGEAKTSGTTTLLLEMLKNTAVFKEMGSFGNDLARLLEHPDTKNLDPQTRKILESFRHSLQNSGAALLKKQIEQSGIFFESKLARALEAGEIVKDMKAALLKAGAALGVSGGEASRLAEKLLLQIEYFQLLSYLQQGSALYVPFEWDALEEGHLLIKKGKRTYCDIALTLKEIGAVRLRLMLYDENQITLHLFCDNDTFKQSVREALGQLRGAFGAAGLDLGEVRLFAMPKEESEAELPSAGFEVRV
ncbi:MAG: flagellar hook-length control protein FliK [Campylobacterales bacterium]|nr:flagellar hook-length control protein FliK [Campylobacterales bacterium]